MCLTLEGGIPRVSDTGHLPRERPEPETRTREKPCVFRIILAFCRNFHIILSSIGRGNSEICCTRDQQMESTGRREKQDRKQLKAEESERHQMMLPAKGLVKTGHCPIAGGQRGHRSQGCLPRPETRDRRDL